jgi:hypothetical protein
MGKQGVGEKKLDGNGAPTFLSALDYSLCNRPTRMSALLLRDVFSKMRIAAKAQSPLVNLRTQA